MEKNSNNKILIAKVAKEEFYGAKKPIKIWDVNVDNIVISKLVDRIFR